MNFKSYLRWCFIVAYLIIFFSVGSLLLLLSFGWYGVTK